MIRFKHFLTLISLCLPWCTVRADTQPLINEKSYGILAAFGDFDSNKLTDVFVISGDGLSFSILAGFKNEPLLQPNKKWQCDLKKTKGSEVIVSLMPADFHGMAMMDVLVVARNLSNAKSLNLYLIKGDKSSLDCSQLRDGNPFATVKSEPLLMDFNGDMITDILAQSADDSKRYVWTAKLNATFEKQAHFGVDSFAEPNSNAFVDLNNDELPDLFVAGKDTMELWYMESLGYAKEPVIAAYPDKKYKVRGQSTFVDINADGIIDHLMPVCEDDACEKSFVLAFVDQHRWIVIGANFSDTDNSTQPLAFVKPFQVGQGATFPLTLRQADVDGDGFPDVIAIMKPSGKNSGEKVVILQNIATDENDLKRKFVSSWTIKVPNGRKPVLAAFFDLYEDGKPDVLVTTIDKDKEKDPSGWRVNAIINTAMFDACFLKVMVASGLCFEDCSAVKSPASSPSIEANSNSNSPVAYGTNQPGPNICYELIDLEGFKRHACQGQLTQSAHFALQMPYAIFGLGPTPNFVDTLTATIPGPGTAHMRQANWTQIVPDAQVVLIPYPPDNPHAWRHKLFLTPSDIVLSTLITLAIICCLLILLIAVLHRKEILEDLAEHEEYKRHWPDSR